MRSLKGAFWKWSKRDYEYKIVYGNTYIAAARSSGNWWSAAWRPSEVVFILSVSIHNIVFIIPFRSWNRWKYVFPGMQKACILGSGLFTRKRAGPQKSWYFHAFSVLIWYSYRDYFTSSNVRNIFRQCGFVGLSGAKSVEQAHFFVKGLLTVYHLERMLQNSSDGSQNPAQTYDPGSLDGSFRMREHRHDVGENLQ